MSELWAFIPVGLFTGLLVGLTGMGGAALTTPVLMLFGGLSPLAAVGTDLVYSAATKMAGAGVHWRNNSVDKESLRRLAAGSIPAGLVTVALLKFFVAEHRDAVNSVMIHALAIALAGSAIVILFRTWKGRLHGDTVSPCGPVSGATPRTWATVVAGVAVGSLVALSSVGSGVLVCAYLTLATAMPAQRIVGTDVVHGFVLTLAVAAGHLSLGAIRWDLVIALLVGSVPGVILGARLTSRVSEPALKTILATVLILAAAGLLNH
jgi:uncharacterized protein